MIITMPSTVDGQMKRPRSILSKLGANSRAQAVALARDAGLGRRNVR